MRQKIFIAASIILLCLWATLVNAQQSLVETKRLNVHESIYFDGAWHTTWPSGQKDLNWFNVARAGGDSTGISNVSSLVQAGINAGYKVIYFPKGKWYLSSTLQLKDSVSIIGDGAATIIKLTGNIPAFKLSISQGGNYATIQDIMITGTYSTGATTAQDGILLDSAYAVNITNVRALNVGGYGIHIKNNGYCCGTYTANATRGVDVNFCYVNSSYGGIFFESKAEYNRVTGGSYNGNVYGYRNSASGNEIVTGASFSNNTYGVYITGGGNDGHGTITGCMINHNRTPLYLSGVTRGMYLSNNNIYGDWDSIQIINSSRIDIQGGYMTVNSGTGKIYYNNTSNCTITNVGGLLGITSSYSIVGTAPTVISSGQNDIPGLSFTDVKNNKRMDIIHSNGYMNIAGGQVGVNTSIGDGYSRFQVTGSVKASDTVTASVVVAKNVIWRSVTVEDQNVTAVAGTAYILGTPTADRNITIPAYSDGNLIEIAVNNAGIFNWNLAGPAVLDETNNTITTMSGNGRYVIRGMGGSYYLIAYFP